GTHRHRADAAEGKTRLADDAVVHATVRGEADEGAVAVAPGELIEARAPACARHGTATAVTISSSRSAVIQMPRQNRAAGISRAPSGPAACRTASRARRQAGSAAAGSARATLPPRVPRARMARWPTWGMACAMSGA